jgi:enamine deaminase RidA (YjgF/YER057c/UK114 family)
MSHDAINPPGLGPASGFSHGCLARRDARLLLVAGQIGVIQGDTSFGEELLAAQFGEALRRVLMVVEQSGGKPEDVARMTVFVTDMELYRQSRKVLGTVWKASMGAHYPAMSLVEVKSLVDPQAMVEIEATAMIGGG